ncbi:hypothetical protein [Microlunatus sp. GCM10028923]|uniref:hypothetical protein n=1 Tax=Microlunatus sp. GCM10028923 TaxID=3273400 RepID=UPI00361EC905
MQPSSPWARRLVILITVPAVTIAAVFAGLYLYQQQAATRTVNPAGPASSSSSDTAKVKQAISDCRREVALAESVLSAADDGVRNWRERVQAQTDLSLGRISEKEAKDIWNRTGNAGPSDIAKYQTAKSAYRADNGACSPVKGATDAETEQLKTCRARVGKVGPALSAADLTLKDWEIHLGSTPASVRPSMDPDGVWRDSWRKAPTNLNKYSDAMDTLAKTKSCPR